MNRLTGVLLVFLVLPAAIAEEKLRDFSWSELRAAGKARPGEVLTTGPEGARECLLVVASEAGGTRA
jgi:hypothetical protein